VLEVLAALTPAAEHRPAASAIPLDWFRWLPLSGVGLFVAGSVQGWAHNGAPVGRAVPAIPALGWSVSIERRFGERLAAVNQVRAGRSSLRAGWLFVAGHTADGHRIFQPLLTVPIGVNRIPLLSAELFAAGDVALTPLITDPTVRHKLEGEIEYGGGALDGLAEPAAPPNLLARLDRLAGFAAAAAEAAGFGTRTLVPAAAGPDELMHGEGLRIVAGVGVFAVNEPAPVTRSGSLRAWIDTSPRDRTALDHLYFPLDDGPVATRGDTVDSPFVLTPAQRDAVVASRVQPLTVLSGAPGTGKSHTIVAIAADGLARGQRVLIASKSDDAVDALLNLLERAPGPDPVVFGSHERRIALAERLAAGQNHPTLAATVEHARKALERSRSERDRLLNQISRLLEAETCAAEPVTSVDSARLLAPGFFNGHCDLSRAQQLVAEAADESGSWLHKRRVRRARAALCELGGASSGEPLATIADCLRAALSHQQAARLAAGGGLDLKAGFDNLAAAETDASRQMGSWLDIESRSSEHVNSSTLGSVAALATALRSGRSARRQQLARLDRKLTGALPLWIGSLPDIDDLLPAVSDLFDLVILDEAASIDQPLAASALLRAERAVIVGDPRQLRHVSFVSDAQIEEALRRFGLDSSPELAARLDARRNSIFDAAVGVVPTITLQEHFRSNPHLIDWVAETIYGRDLLVATRTPLTENINCVQVHRTQNTVAEDGAAVTAEIDFVISELRRLSGQHATSVGVITPFRAQADALEAAVLNEFDADQLEAMDLRVGTVHAFQGSERDIVIASIALTPGADANSWKFINDPHLFCVLVTRARKQFTITLSTEPPGKSLLADYLAEVDQPKRRRPTSHQADPWTQRIAHELAASPSLQTATGYQTGRHLVDIAATNGSTAFSVETAVHPDGPPAHIDRRLSLMRAGWTVLDAYPSKWESQTLQLTIEILHQTDSHLAKPPSNMVLQPPHVTDRP
jgi:hypothetical protein